jgi:hypothetical protein
MSVDVRQRARLGTAAPPPIIIDDVDDAPANVDEGAPNTTGGKSDGQKIETPSAETPAPHPRPAKPPKLAPRVAQTSAKPSAAAPRPRRKRNISIIMQNGRALTELELIERKLSDMRGEGRIKGAIGPTRILAMGLRMLTDLDEAELEQLALDYSDEMADE